MPLSTRVTRPDDPKHYRLSIEGMSCQHCVERVEQALKAVNGITHIDVSLEKGSADIEGGLPHQAIDALNKAGYPANPLVEEPASCELAPDSGSSTASVQGNRESYRIDIGNMSCASCVSRVEKAILAVTGVETATVNLIEGIAVITGGDPEQVVNAVVDSGYPAHYQHSPASIALRVQIETDGVSSETISQSVRTLDKNLQVTTLAANRFEIITAAHAAEVLEILESAGYKVQLLEPDTGSIDESSLRADRDIKLAWRRAWLAGMVGAGLMAGTMSGVLPAFDSSTAARTLWSLLALLCLFTMTYSGGQYYKGAWKQARHGTANMDTLVALGTAAAWFSSILLLLWPDLIPGKKHLYLDTSVLILAFLQFGYALETRARGKTRAAIRALTELAPATGVLVRGKNEYEMPVAYIQVGDIIRIRPGSRIPIDSVVESGQSNVDESMLSGESLPVSKQTGDSLVGGSINDNGSLLARVTRHGDDTTLARIINRVKQAQASKPPIGRLVDKIAAVFVPVVLLIAFVTFMVWISIGPEPRAGFALTAAIAVLVIACPCALGLATPIAIMVGTGRAAQSGILIRNADALQAASRLSHLVIDKTGTLTEGSPRVTRTIALNTNDTGLLQIAASLEIHSEHPLASAIVEAARKNATELLTVNGFQADSGRGIRGSINGTDYLLGNARYLKENNIHRDSSSLQSSVEGSATSVFLADNTRLLGIIFLEDPLRRDSLKAVQKLQESGIEIVMCTGDNRHIAENVAAKLGIRQIHSEVLPEQKADIVQALQQKGYHVGMAGDGINDAPALAQANVGFAIGSGTDIAMENADVTLASNSLDSIGSAISLSRATIRNIKQNLFGAFIYNVTGIPLAAGVLYPLTGLLLSPVFASAAMALSSLTVVSNANRLRLIKLD